MKTPEIAEGLKDLKGTISRIGWEKLVLEINDHPCRVLEMKKNEPRPT